MGDKQRPTSFKWWSHFDLSRTGCDCPRFILREPWHPLELITLNRTSTIIRNLKLDFYKPIYNHWPIYYPSPFWLRNSPCFLGHGFKQVLETFHLVHVDLIVSYNCCRFASYKIQIWGGHWSTLNFLWYGALSCWEKPLYDAYTHGQLQYSDWLWLSNDARLDPMFAWNTFPMLLHQHQKQQQSELLAPNSSVPWIQAADAKFWFYHLQTPVLG